MNTEVCGSPCSDECAESLQKTGLFCEKAFQKPEQGSVANEANKIIIWGGYD